MERPGLFCCCCCGGVVGRPPRPPPRGGRKGGGGGGGEERQKLLFAHWTENELVKPAACQEIKLAFYMTRDPRVFPRFLDSVVRRRVLRPTMSAECEDRIFRAALDERAKPADVILAMGETLGRDVALHAIAYVLRGDNPGFTPDDLEPFDLQSCYFETYRDTERLAVSALVLLFQELSPEEFERTKTFLRWELFKPHRLRARQCNRDTGVDGLCFRILAYYQAKARYVTCVIFELVGRGDLAKKLRDS